MHVKDFAEAMKNLPARFSNLTFWRECRKLKDSVVDALEYLNNWGINIENVLDGKLPKSPTDWENWTSDEQDTARSKIGAEKALGVWEDIATVTNNEPASWFTLDKDDNGNPFALSHVALECVIPPEETTIHRSVNFANRASTSKNFSRIDLTKPANSTSIISTYAHIVSGRILCESTIADIYNNTRYNPAQVYAIVNSYASLIADSINSICVFTYQDPLPAGTKVIVRGIRK